jgi:FMN reductase
MTSSNESAWRDDGDGDGFSNGDGRGDSPNERHERMSIAVVVGNPKTGSRTLRVAQAVADILVDRLIATDQLGDNTERFVVDLADVARELFDYPSQKIDDLLASVAASDLVIAASPTYKATYTGLLKVFFDRYGNNGLAGTVGVPVMTGAAPIHALAPELHLRPLLVELGATTPTRGLYVTESQFDDLDGVIGAWADAAAPLVGRALPAP